MLRTQDLQRCALGVFDAAVRAFAFFVVQEASSGQYAQPQNLSSSLCPLQSVTPAISVRLQLLEVRYAVRSVW